MLVLEELFYFFQRSCCSFKDHCRQKSHELFYKSTYSILYIQSEHSQLQIDGSATFLSENIPHEKKQLDIPTNLKLTKEHMNPMFQINQAVIFFANAIFSPLLVCA